jgi:hypothetical protein
MRAATIARMKQHSFTRREFLSSSAAAATVANLAPAALWTESSIAVQQLTAVPDWASKPMRWFQLTLVEDDPIHYDPAFWLEYFKRTRTEGVCLSGGGCVAYYPTRIPFHHRSAWLGNGDALGELIGGCRKMGMSVLVRTDPHATYDDAKEARPDWIAVDAEGNPRRHWASPEMWLTCAYGPYNFEFMTEVQKEIMTLYRPDGLFHNRWDGNGICYCVHCRQNFHDAAGVDLPKITDPANGVYVSWQKWRRERLIALVDIWNSAIRAINPISSCIPNNGSGALNSLDSVELSNRAPLLTADRQCRSGLACPWIIGKTAKEYRATMGAKPVIGLFGVGLEEPYRWKDSVTSDAEIRIWALEAIANGMRPWCSKFSGTLHDERWLAGVEELYVWTEQNRRHLVHENSFARVAIVYSQQSAWHLGDSARIELENHALGWCQAMIESRIPFEMVHDQLLDPAHLAPFKLLILPNVLLLSDAQCDQLRAFVAAGGSIIATYETSTLNPDGSRRKNFGLADLFGVDSAGRSEGPMLNSYIRLEHDAESGSPFFNGLEHAPRIINAVNRHPVVPQEKFAHTPFTLIPSYPDLPMEKVYPRVEKTDVSCLYLRQPAGRVAYFPMDIDRTFWECLSADHLCVLRNTILWALNEPPVISLEGPGLLDVNVWRNPSSVSIHLLNLTNPMAMKGPFREFIPVGPQKVHLNLQVKIDAAEAKLLVAASTVPIERYGNILSVHIPSILDHEVIAINV